MRERFRTRPSGGLGVWLSVWVGSFGLAPFAGLGAEEGAESLLSLRPAVVLVKLRPEAREQQMLRSGQDRAPELLARVGASSVRALFAARPRAGTALGLERVWRVELAAGTDAAQALQKLGGEPQVEWVELDGPVRAAGIPDDPLFAGQWALHNTGQQGGTPDADVDGPEAWDVTIGEAGVVIAVLDTGVDLDHPDLTDKLVLVPGADVVHSDDVPQDENGHGTHVAGVAAASGNNGVGVAGMCPACSVMPVQVLDEGGVGTFSRLAAGIELAADAGARVLNLSLGSPTPSQAVSEAVEYALSRQCVLVAAAGNQGSSEKFYPAALPGVLAVGATDRWDRPWSWSNHGDWVSLAAPGLQISSSVYDDAYASWSGTSQAAALVSGAAGLVLSQNHPMWFAHRVREQLKRTSDALQEPGLGAGRLNAHRAVSTEIATELSLVTVEVRDSAGDADGRVDVGEAVHLVVTLRSDYGFVDGLGGTLSTSSAGVSVTDGNGSWARISSGLSEANEADPFGVTVNAPAEAGDQLEFTLQLTAAGFSGSFNFSLQMDGGTELPGQVFCEDTVLQKDVYIVRDDVLVCEGKRLTIEPGTVLKFVKKTPPIEFAVDGKLSASGTEQEPIAFTSAEPSPAPGDWGPLHFRDSSADGAAWAGEVLLSGGDVLTAVIGDADNNGTPDIVSANDFSNSLSIFRLNQGSWTREDLALDGMWPTAVLIGDVDDDGDNDLVASTVDALHGLVVFRWTGAGWVRETIDLGGEPSAVALHDLHGDKGSELVVNNGHVVLVRWLGSEWVSETVADGVAGDLRVGDVDDNGSIDIVTAGDIGVAVFRWSGTNWERTDLATSGTVPGINLGDLDGDGGLEIVAGADDNPATRLDVFWWEAGGWRRDSIRTNEVSPFAAVGDADNDGQNEILVGRGKQVTLFNWRSGAWIERGRGELLEIDTNTRRVSPAIGDVDGDGDNDLVFSFFLDCICPRPGEVQVLRYLSPEDGSTFGHGIVEWGRGIRVTAASPYLSDLTVRDNLGGIVGDAASNQVMQRVLVSNPGSVAVRGGGASLEHGHIQAGSISVSNIEESTLEHCGNVEAQLLYDSTVEDCGNVTARVVQSTLRGNGSTTSTAIQDSQLLGNRARIQAGSIVGSFLVGNAGGVEAGSVVDSMLTGNTSGLSGVTGAVSGTLILGNGNVGLRGTPEITESTVVRNGTDQVRLDGASSATGSVLEGPGLAGNYTVRQTANAAADFRGNWWGPVVTAEMQQKGPEANIGAIWDFWDDPVDLTQGKVQYSDWLLAPPAGAPAYLQTLELTPPSPVGAESVSFTLRFSGSMDPNTPPAVTFGLAEPYESGALEGLAWSNGRVANDTLSGHFTFTGYQPNGDYRLKVSGANQANGRLYPEDASFGFVLSTVTAQTEGVAATWIGGGRVRVSWQRPCCGAEAKVAGYRVHYSHSSGGPDEGAVERAGVDTTTALLVGLEPGTTYFIRVAAYDTTGVEGEASREVSVDLSEALVLEAQGMLGAAILTAVLGIGTLLRGVPRQRRRSRRCGRQDVTAGTGVAGKLRW